MLEYIIVKKEKIVEASVLTDGKDIIFCKKGDVNIKNLRDSSFTEYISNIPSRNQLELDESGQTEFTVLTETTISLKSLNTTAVLQDLG